MADFGHETLQAFAKLRVRNTQHDGDLEVVIAFVAPQIDREWVERYESGRLG